MTGLERLRKLANDLCYDAADASLFDQLEQGTEAFWGVSYKHDSTLREALFAIAKQVEREHAQTIEDHEKQQGIIRDLQRERDEALRAARSANDALGEIKKWSADFMWDNRGDAYLKGQGNLVSRMCDCADNSSEDAEAAKWVREHGFDGAIDQHRKGERVKLPAVLAADGEPLEVGQTVWEVATGERYAVVEIYHGTTEPDFPLHCVKCEMDGDVVSHMFEPSKLTHQRPVLDADGAPIKKGDTVYWLEHTVAFTVVSPHETHDNAGYELKCGHTVEIAREGQEPHLYVHPESLHHTKPEPIDSWDKWRREMLMSVTSYVSAVMGEETLGVEYSNLEDMATRDLMNRAKALSERESGE